MHTYTPVSVNSDRLVAKLLAEMVYQYKGVDKGGRGES